MQTEQRCSVCGTEFIPAVANGIYCSKSCQRISMKRRWRARKRAGKKPTRITQAAYMPTAEQIAEAAAEIRAGWSDREEVKRRADDHLRPERYEFPEIG